MATDITVNLTPAVALGVTIDRTGAQGLQGTVAVASNAETLTGTDTVKAVTPAGLRSVAATNAETIVGTLTTKWVSPASLAAHDATYFFDPHDYGATGDGTASDTAGIQAALNAAGATIPTGSLGQFHATVKLRPAKTYRAAGLSVPEAVVLDLNGSMILANATGWMITLASSTSVKNGGVKGQWTTVANEGIYIPPSIAACILDNLFIQQMSGRGIRDEGIVTRINGVYTENCLLVTTGLTVPTGTCEVVGTDAWVTDSEFNAARSSLSVGGFVYAFLLGGSAAQVSNVVGEISDHGMYLNGTGMRVTNCRADLNWGHGFVFGPNGSGNLSNSRAERNSRTLTNTYDGFHAAINGPNWLVDNCSAQSLPGEPAHRYGFYVGGNGGYNHMDFGPTNRSRGHGTASVKVTDAWVEAATGPFRDSAAAATTLNVDQGDYGWPQSRWGLKSTSAVNFTAFTGGVPGQRIMVWGDGFTTFVHNAGNLAMLSGANTLAGANTIYEFVTTNGTYWKQV